MTFDFYGSDIFLIMISVSAILVMAAGLICFSVFLVKKRKKKFENRHLLAMEAQEDAFRVSEKERVRFIQTEKLRVIYQAEMKAAKEEEVRAKQEAEMRALIERYGGPALSSGPSLFKDIVDEDIPAREKITLNSERSLMEEEAFGEEGSPAEEEAFAGKEPFLEDTVTPEAELSSNEDLSREWKEIEEVYTNLLNTNN